jgi:hypothetical protein
LGHHALANQLLTGSPVAVGVQVVGVRAVLRKFPLCGLLSGKVFTVYISAVGVGNDLARDAVVIRIQPVWIARIPL